MSRRASTTPGCGISADMVNGHCIAHGGCVFLLADTAFAFVHNTYGERVVARRASIAFVTAVREMDELVATGIERVRYGRTGVYDVTVRNRPMTTRWSPSSAVRSHVMR